MDPLASLYCGTPLPHRAVLYCGLCAGKSGRLDDTRRKYSVLTDKLHKIHNDYVLSMREGCEVQEGLFSSLYPMYLAAQEVYCHDSVVQW